MAAHRHSIVDVPVGLPIAPVFAPAGTRYEWVRKPVTSKRFDRWLTVILIVVMSALYEAGLSVNYGPSMSHLGWFYVISWGTQPTQIGQIVRFAPPDQPIWRKYVGSCIKRVAEIRPDGFWLKGDNVEQSEDCDDWGKAVPANHVAGVVTWCWSWNRYKRSGTEQGRYQNWVDFVSSPGAIQRTSTIWTKSEGGIDRNRVDKSRVVVLDPSRERIGSAPGAIIEPREGGFVSRLYDEKSYTDRYLDYSLFKVVSQNVVTRKRTSKMVKIDGETAEVIAEGENPDQSDAPLHGSKWSSGQVPGAVWEIRFSRAKPRALDMRSGAENVVTFSTDGVGWRVLRPTISSRIDGISVARFPRTNAMAFRVWGDEVLLNITLQKVAFE